MAVGLADRAALALALALGAEGALDVGATVVCVGAGVGEPAITESCVESRPAMASPTASTATSTNGNSVKAVRRRRTARR